ncbi:SNF2-related protein [Thermomonas fusca]|uniref:SNF2-related protein n=1 Tax=Thermomonas fusca TaxID=215690 RepID=UPI0003F57C46|nr:SNF2-related protein [Thermomonas fusca]
MSLIEAAGTAQQAAITPYQAKYYAWMLTRQGAGDSVDTIASTLVNSQVDLNPHQVDAALFACNNPLSRGVLLADEVGLGKTIEAGLVISQRWAERKRRILIITPANLRKQWHQELQDKFGLQATILETKSFNALRKQGVENPFDQCSGPVISSYEFSRGKADSIKALPWDLVVLDEAHRLRNVYKKGNVTARTIRAALAGVPSKVLLTATPLQNSLLELYGLVSVIDDRVFGDIDSFKEQFGGGGPAAMAALRKRIEPVCKRTLRRQVQPYISYTARRAIVQEFTPTADEHRLSALVSDYLRRPKLQALPDGQRQLISMVLWKLLASSPQAIAGALGKMADRLQGVVDQAPVIELLGEALDDDYEALDIAQEQLSAQDEVEASYSERGEDIEAITPEQRQAMSDEVAELRGFQQLAGNLRENSKGAALLQALDRAFAELDRLGANRKALIFTESKRTQAYLLSLLADTPYGDGIVLFNGDNSGPQAQKIYKEWLQQHAGTDRITGSKTADTRAALVEYFCDQGKVMIATEAGGEGINLQFCSLVINYDLPWNPQRIEQRIGRCHRYGQKHDVVVVNFVDLSNEADARVYELLDQKFQLFDGVFGASDEVLGAIGSGVDFERRIADIYRDCRDPEAIKEGFEALQRDLFEEIDQRMLQTRQLLLEHFDEEVQDKLRIRAQDSQDALGRYERMLMEVTRKELANVAAFDEAGFELRALPDNSLTEVPLGRYELPRRSEEAHIYRPGHPLASWVLEQGKSRDLPVANLRFDYGAYAGKISTLEAHRGEHGWLAARLLNVKALGQEEQHLLVSAVTEGGSPLEADDPDKLLRLPASDQPTQVAEVPVQLEQDMAERRDALLREINARNLGYFKQEVDKLEAWADDLKLKLEADIRELDVQIKDAARAAAVAASLPETLEHQERRSKLQKQRTRVISELYTRQDEIASQRDDLIMAIKGQLQQDIEEVPLFTMQWSLV